MAINLPKPRYAAPCNGCGLCCALEVCRVARVAMREAGQIEISLPCMFLVERDGRHRCALVIAEEKAIEQGVVQEGMISRTLAVGWGCTMTDDEEGAAA